MGFAEITFEEFFALFAKQDAPVEPGLSQIECAVIERRYGFTFPPDLREFLSLGIPVGEGWVNWRTTIQKEIRWKLSWPLEGICFDIKNNVFWMNSWIDKPAQLGKQYSVARDAVKQAPVLIPVFSHRYIPDRPSLSGNPVFSVHQTDIIYYGINLNNYLVAEFWREIEHWHISINEFDRDPVPRHVEFWSDVLEQGEEEWRKQNNL
jgi:hypothetical protein